MKISPLAVATILPAAMAGIALSVAAPLAQASASAAPAAAVHAQVRHVADVLAHEAAKPKPKPTTRLHHHHHQHAAAEAGASDAAAGSQDPAQAGPSVTAGESSFEQCVAWRESGDTPTDPDGLFGILPSTWAQLGYSGTAGQAPVALQQVAFSRLYSEYGAQPWAPSDGC
jgi:hypothetical protein